MPRRVIWTRPAGSVVDVGRRPVGRIRSDVHEPVRAGGLGEPDRAAQRARAHQYLLAVSTDGRQFYLSGDSAGPVSENQLGAIEQQRIQPALANGDWAGRRWPPRRTGRCRVGRVGRNRRGGGSGIWAILVVVLLAVAALVIVIVVRSRRRAGVGDVRAAR
jgi:hypothetical protein